MEPMRLAKPRTEGPSSYTPPRPPLRLVPQPPAENAASAAPDEARDVAELLAPPAVVVAERARRWVASRPELAGRMEKAIALVGGVSLVEANTYRVEGGAGDYTVRVDRVQRYSECTCPDSAVRGQKCKHRLAVALVLG